MNWDVFGLIGTIAFTMSGAYVAIEEEFDILGVFVLGLVTSFGGGVIRNLLIGEDVTALSQQGIFIITAVIALMITFFLPLSWMKRWKHFGLVFDSIGLSTFAIQGALYASNLNLPLSTVIVAAVLTGIGGGIIRDVLAGRKPLVLRDEIYAAWAALAGIIIYFGWSETPTQLYSLFVFITILRIMSHYYGWKLPRRAVQNV